MRRAVSDQDRHRDSALDEARPGLAWLRRVDGRLMRRRAEPDDPAAWVAIVKTPSEAGAPGRLILGFGASAHAAVATAHTAWLDECQELGTLH